MLEEAIAHAREAAEDVRRLGVQRQKEAETVRSHVLRFEREVVPELGRGRTRVAAAAATLLASTRDVATRHAENGPLAELLLKSAQNDVAAFDAAQEDLERVDERLESFRAQFADDVATLVSLRIRRAADAQAAEQERDRASREARKLRRRIDTINKVSIINPLVKLGSELANLVTKRKTTEQSLSSTNQRLARAKARVAELHAALAAAEPVKALLDQLTLQVQDVKNALTVVESKLKAGAGFAAEIRNEPELFLNALDSSVAQLEQIIGGPAAPSAALRRQAVGA